MSNKFTRTTAQKQLKLHEKQTKSKQKKNPNFDFFNVIG